MIGAATTLLLDGGACCGPMVGGGWLGMLAGSLIVLGLIVLVAWVTRRRSTPPDRGMSALEILAARHANGEITDEEYDRHRSTLQRGSAGRPRLGDLGGGPGSHRDEP